MTRTFPTHEPVRPRALPVWVFVSAAWLGPAILAAFRAYVQGGLGNRPPPTWRIVLWEGGDWLLYALLTPVVFWLARRHPLNRGTLLRRVPIHVAGAILLCAAWAAGGQGLGWVLFGEPSAPTGVGYLGWFMTSLPFGVAVYFAVLGVEHAAFYFVEAREGEAQAARLAAQLSEARLGALRMQLQPHFLLNTLNAITVLVRDRDTATATRMLERLGEILRRVLRAERPREVPLADELDFAAQYLELEAMRFPDRLQPVVAVDPSLRRAAVPEFLLQPLIENAIRHGLARRTGATLLRIEATREALDLVLSVVDDGPGPAPDVAAVKEGVGLGNTRARLDTLYGERASLTLTRSAAGGAAATVRIPYREMGQRRD